MQFNYIARTKQGEMQNGVVEAINQKAAVGTLQNRGLIILDLRSTDSGSFLSLNIKIFQRVKQKELSSFARQLSTLISAEVPILTSLQSLYKQIENEYLRNVVFEVANDVEGGTIFSKALAKHPKIFSDFFVSMIRSGEVSGNLENSLSYLADYLERQYYINSRVRGALMYPAVIFCVFLIIAFLMMILVIPKLTSFLTESGQELPLVTKVIIGVSDFLRGWWWLLLAAIAAGSYYGYYAVKNYPIARRRWDILKLKMPVFGKRIFQKIYITRMAENLSTLIKGGLSILQALQVTSQVVGNVIFRDIISEAREEVRVGSTLSGSLSKYKEIPPLVTQMVATGEQTGSLDMILQRMGQFYGREVDYTIDTLSQLIEPIMIVVIGAAVAFLVAGILLPIYNIASIM